MLSEKFKIAIKMSETPAWKIAYAAGVHPNVLSKSCQGQCRIKPGDDRVIRVGGEIVGLSAEQCFQDDKF